MTLPLHGRGEFIVYIIFLVLQCMSNHITSDLSHLQVLGSIPSVRIAFGHLFGRLV